LSITVDQELVETVRAIAERAGRAILEVYGTDFDVARKDDASPVTEADRRAERLILDAIRGEIGSDYPIVAEEAVDAGDIPEVGDRPFWLVDPLDGTKQFVKRQGEFTVNIALIEHRRPLLGVVHAPALSGTYWGSPLGAFAASDGDTPRAIACRVMPSTGAIAVASRSHRNAETDAFLARYDLADSISAGSSIKFCLVAAGKADLYPRTGRTMEWDTAAGHAVVRFAGGTVTDMDGRELLYAKPGFENPHFVVRGLPPNT
jgi:3'(2'), 5'-bisphosphate nucleotidase